MKRKKPRKTNNNRRRGNAWERECAKRLKHLFPNIVTSRSESRSRDNYGIDLMNKDERKNGELPYEFQCKNLQAIPRYDYLLKHMPGDNPPVVLHKHTEKRGQQFYEIGTYAIMKMDDFITLLEQLNGTK